MFWLKDRTFLDEDRDRSGMIEMIEFPA
jgi:Ca2+-binding EF-hand superfamily protein